MKKFEKLGKSLSKNEMRKVVGGVAAPCHCTCSGGTGGSWQYSGGVEPNGAKIASDIAQACSTGVATCGGCANIYN